MKVRKDESYNEQSVKEYFFEADILYLANLHSLHNDLPFLLERTTIEKVENLVVNLHNKNAYVIHIRSLKQASNHKLQAWTKYLRKTLVFM